MNDQVDKPLEDKVYVLTKTYDEDGYDFKNMVFSTKDAALKEMLRGHQEDIDIAIEQGALNSDDLESSDYSGISEQNGSAYLSDDCRFGYYGSIKEEVINE